MGFGSGIINLTHHALPGQVASGAEEEEFDELLEVLEEDSGARWIAVLFLYLDDGGSQTDASHPVFAGGGYVATRDAWRSVRRQWEAVHTAFKAPPYHGTDAQFPGFEAFRDWGPKEKFTNYHSALATVLIEHNLVGVGRTVEVPDYEATIGADPMFGQVSGGQPFAPVIFCLRTCLEWIALTWPDRPRDEKIAVIFESGTKHIGTAGTYFEWLRRNTRWAGDTFTTFALMTKRVSAIQTADMLAYEVYKEADRRLYDPRRAERILMQRLRARGLMEVRHAGRKDMETILAALRERYGAIDDADQSSSVPDQQPSSSESK